MDYRHKHLAAFARKRKKKKNVSEILIEHFRLTSEDRQSDEDETYLRAVNELVRKREMDDVEIPDLLSMFHTSNKSKYASVKDFYLWYKDNRIDGDDAYIYTVYKEVASSLGSPIPDAKHFSGMGEQLLARILEWCGECGNEPEDILIEYFEACVRTAGDFNRAILHSPTSLLSDYGWSIWEDWVKDHYGSKEDFLKPTNREVEKEKEKNFMFSKIYDELRRRLDSAKNAEEYRVKLKEYDDTLDDLAARGHKIIYSEMFGNK